MNTRAAVVLRGLLALAALLAAAGTAAARDVVGIRASEQAGYARLVFDWSEPVAFTAATRDRNLWIRFDRPLRADPGTLVRLLARYVAAARLSEDGKGLDIALTAPLRLDSFAMGKSVVFDLRPVGAAAKTWRGIHVAGFTDSARSADSTVPALPVRVGDHEKYLRLVFDWAKPVAENYNIVRAANPAPSAGHECLHRSATRVTGDPNSRSAPMAASERSTARVTLNRPTALCAAMGNTN